MGPLLNAAHHVASRLQSLFRVIPNPQFNKQVRESHDAKADAAGLLAHLFDFRDWIVIHIDNVVQQVDGDIDGLIQAFPVDHGVAVGDVDHAGYVDRGQVARLVRQQGLLAARVGAFDFTQLWVGVVPVDHVQEN